MEEPATGDKKSWRDDDDGDNGVVGTTSPAIASASASASDHGLNQKKQKQNNFANTLMPDGSDSDEDFVPEDVSGSDFSSEDTDTNMESDSDSSDESNSLIPTTEANISPENSKKKAENTEKEKKNDEKPEKEKKNDEKTENQKKNSEKDGQTASTQSPPASSPVRPATYAAAARGDQSNRTTNNNAETTRSDQSIHRLHLHEPVGAFIKPNCDLNGVPTIFDTRHLFRCKNPMDLETLKDEVYCAIIDELSDRYPEAYQILKKGTNVVDIQNERVVFFTSAEIHEYLKKTFQKPVYVNELVGELSLFDFPIDRYEPYAVRFLLKGVVTPTHTSVIPKNIKDRFSPYGGIVIDMRVDEEGDQTAPIEYRGIPLFESSKNSSIVLVVFPKIRSKTTLNPNDIQSPNVTRIKDINVPVCKYCKGYHARVDCPNAPLCTCGSRAHRPSACRPGKGQKRQRVPEDEETNPPPIEPPNHRRNNQKSTLVNDDNNATIPPVAESSADANTTSGNASVTSETVDLTNDGHSTSSEEVNPRPKINASLGPTTEANDIVLNYGSPDTKMNDAVEVSERLLEAKGVTSRFTTTEALNKKALPQVTKPVGRLPSIFKSTGGTSIAGPRNQTAPTVSSKQPTVADFPRATTTTPTTTVSTSAHRATTHPSEQNASAENTSSAAPPGDDITY